MNWTAHVSAFDEDSIRLLRIAGEFLVQYFGYSETGAAELLDGYFRRHGGRFDEDFYHHEGAYRTAAIIHYLQGLGGDPEELGKWLLDEGHNNPPPEAFEYFREHYFGNPD